MRRICVSWVGPASMCSARCFSDPCFRHLPPTFSLLSPLLSSPSQRDKIRKKKQELIAQASRYMDEHSSSTSSSSSSSSSSNNNKNNLEEISNLAAAAQSTVSKPPLTARMASSLTSTLVARLVSNLRAKATNIRVILVQDTTSVGVTVDAVTLDNDQATFRFRGEVRNKAKEGRSDGASLCIYCPQPN